MRIKSKIFSLILFCFYFLKFEDMTGLNRDIAAKLFILPLIGVILIWFSEGLGGFTGSLGFRHRVNIKTHPILLRFFGWILMLIHLVIILFSLTVI